MQTPYLGNLFQCYANNPTPASQIESLGSLVSGSKTTSFKKKKKVWVLSFSTLVFGPWKFLFPSLSEVGFIF